MNNKFWEFKNISDDIAELYIYSEIIPWEDEDMTSSASFKKDLESHSNAKQLKIHINSPGGSVFDGIAIASMIKRFKGETICYVDGLSASIASVITASCDKVIMPSNAMQMIHNALSGGFMFANAKEFRKMADDLDKISASIRQSYLSKSNGKVSEEELIELMDKETWLSADECLAYGLCDEVVSANKMVASVPSKFNNLFNNIPKQLLNKEGDLVEDNKEVVVEEVEETTEVIEEVKDENIDEVTEEVNEVENSIDDEVKKKKKKCESEEIIADEKESEISDLKLIIENLTNEKSDLENKLNEANEKVIALNEKIDELKPIVDKYNNEIAKQKEIKDKQLLDEKREYYKNKFEKLGARAKFESDEVQNLVNNCVKDKDSLSKLNLMLVDMIKIESETNSRPKIEQVTKIENLIPSVDSIEEKYGFK